jgi:hypothetical protein
LNSLNIRLFCLLVNVSIKFIMYQARGVIDTLIVSENLSRDVGCIFVVQVCLGGGIAY